LATVAVVAVGTLLFTACSAPSSTSTGKDTKLSNSGPLSITWYGSDARNQLVAQVVSDFGAKNPSVKIETSPTAFATYWDRVSVQAAGKSLACVPTMQTRYEAKFENKGSLLPLDALVKDGTIDVSKISRNSIKNQKGSDGKLYAIPYGYWFEGAVYNETAIKGVGASLPKANWGWSDYVDWAKTVQPKLASGTYALGDRGGQITQFQSFALQHGEDLFGKNKVGFTTKTLTDWFTLWNDARKAGVVPTADMTAQDQNAPTSANLLAKGNVLVSSTGDNNVADSQKALSAINGGTLQMVGSPTGGKPQVVGSNSWAISSNCTNVKDAAAFINYFVNTPSVATTLQAQTGLPVDNSIMNAELNDSSTDPAIKARISLFQDISKAGARVDVWPDKTQSLVNLFENTYEQIAFGKTSIANGVKAFMEQANTALAGF